MNSRAPRAFHLVTGALGFVGLNLVTGLLESGHRVLGVGKNLHGGELPDSAGPFRKSGPAPDLPGAALYEGPAGTMTYASLAMEQPGSVVDLVHRVQPGAVYHLAAQSSAAVSFTEPAQTFESNLMGTLHLLEAVRALPESVRPRVLSIGSCEEYGSQAPDRYPLTEETPVDPLSPYGVSKAAQTMLCRQYARSFGLEVVMVRSFSHTGPGHDTRFAFPSFARQIAAAEAGVLPADIAVGDLTPVRDFLDVRDVVSAYQLLAADGIPGEIYNVCSGHALTMQGGLDILVAESSVPITIRRDPDRARPSDIPVMVGDNTKLRKLTGWKPVRDIADTLRSLLVEARKEFS